MARIKYLIQNPNEVEYNDLDLLNTEIDKYPYFYSLRALKLLALKKGNDDSYDEELKVTSIYSPNRKALYNFIHQTANKSEEINSINSDSEIVIENIDSIKDINFDDTSDNLEEITINNFNIDEVIQENINPESAIESEELIEEIVSTEDELISDEVIKVQQEEKLTKIVDNPIAKDISNEDNLNIYDYGEPSAIEEISPVEAITEETIETGEFSIDQPTIESIIEEIKQQDYSTQESDQKLIDFDLPSLEDQVKMDQSIENSLEIAKQFFVEDLSTDKIEKIENIETKIEEVSLINRASKSSINPAIEEIKKSVSTLTPFQIQNNKNEIIGGFNQDVIKTPEVNEIVIENLIEPTSLIIDRIEVENNHSNEIESLVTETVIEPIVEIEEINSDSETIIDNITNEIKEKVIENEKSIIISKDDSLSFNDWLKLPQYQSENTPEKDAKFQIIDEFLEKNPKITPVKKQEIPVAKNQIKDLKQTDFSDLMTETLAQIYIEQKQYEKAIRAYKILSLKYPEKNSLFAKQIKEIEILKNSK